MFALIAVQWTGTLITMSNINDQWNDHYRIIGQMKHDHQQRQRKKWKLLTIQFVVCFILLTIGIIYE